MWRTNKYILLSLIFLASDGLTINKIVLKALIYYFSFKLHNKHPLTCVHFEKLKDKIQVYSHNKIWNLSRAENLNTYKRDHVVAQGFERINRKFNSNVLLVKQFLYSFFFFFLCFFLKWPWFLSKRPTWGYYLFSPFPIS
jgi:hypothetical protein